MTERETFIVRELKEKLDKLIELHLKAKNENIRLIEELSSTKEHVQALTLQNEELVKNYFHY